MRDEYTGQSDKIFKDRSKLSFDYVPEELVHRDKQRKQLWMMFRPILEKGISQSAFLIGSVGTGKTALAKRFCLDFVDASRKKGRTVDFVVVNCRQRSSENSVLLRLVTHFDEGYPDRGFSSAEMLRSLKKHLEKEGVHLIIVLDEADVLIKKGADDLIYNLSRFDEEKVGKRGSVSLMLISQKYVLDELDSASISTFRRANTIRFDAYSSEELRDIVSQRVDLAFYPQTVNEDSIDLIADISSEWGDARFAIELLEKGGMLAVEEVAEKVTAEHIRGAKALTYSVVTESRLREIDRQRKLVLLAVARTMRDRAYVTTGEVEENYSVAAEEYGERPRGHTQFWSYLQDLSNEGLIETRVGSNSSGGRTTYISLPDIPAKALKERLQSILE